MYDSFRLSQRTYSLDYNHLHGVYCYSKTVVAKPFASEHISVFISIPISSSNYIPIAGTTSHLYSHANCSLPDNHRLASVEGFRLFRSGFGYKFLPSDGLHIAQISSPSSEVSEA